MSRPLRARVDPSYLRIQSCRDRLVRTFCAVQLLHVCLGIQWTVGAPRAEAAEVAVQWNAPLECPSQADMRSRVKRALENGSAQPNLAATVNVKRTADAYRAEVRIEREGGTGERVLENVSCDILADSVALIVALSSGDSVHHGLTGALSAHATALSGPLPRLAWGGGGAIAVEGMWALRFELNGSYYAEQSTTYPGTTLGARFNLLRFGARGCRLWSIGRFDVAPCLGAQLFGIAGEGFGGAKFRAETSYSWGPALGALSRMRMFSAFFLVLAADATVLVSRQRFVYREADLGLLHRAGAWAFQLSIAPEVQF